SELRGVWDTRGTIKVRQALAFEVSSQVDFRVMAAIPRTKRIGRQWFSDAGEHGDSLNRTVVAFAAHGARMVWICDFLALAEADAGSQAVAWFHGDGQPC